MALSQEEVFRLVRGAARRAGLNTEDAFTMTSVLARRRHEAVQEESADDSTEFSATILCFIFDPVKSRQQDYVTRMREFRRELTGIATRIEVQAAFESLFSDALLKAKSARHAILMGFGALFVSRYQTRGG